MGEQREWSEEEDATLRQMAAAGFSMAEIAAKLTRGRTRGMVAGRLHRLKQRDGTPTDWTAPELQILAEGVKIGLSSTEIAAKLPGRTRLAVTARANRMGLSLKGASSNPPPPKRAPPAKVVQLPVSPFAPRPPTMAAADNASWAATSDARPLADLAGRCCKWPVGKATGAEQLFCAAPLAADSNRYCAEHAGVGRSATRPADWDRKQARSLKRAMAS